LYYRLKSDVAAKINFAIAVNGTASYAPIKYGLDCNNITLDAAGLQTELNKLTAFQTVADSVGTATQTVYWSWAFETNPLSDTVDTELGVASVKNNRSIYNMNITAIATQIAPEVMQ
jgi:hypothetical protein